MVSRRFRNVFQTALALLLICPAAAWAQAPVNLALSATAVSSSDWNADFAAAKAFDGDMNTRWNSADQDRDGSWLGCTWTTAQTINKVVIRQAFDRIDLFHIQAMDATSGDWKDVATSPSPVNPTGAANPVFTFVFKPALSTKGVRIFADTTKNTSISIFEMEAYNVPIGTLAGTVKDEAGKAIAGVAVTAGTNTALTKDDGTYSMDVDAGTYNVSASQIVAYRTRTQRNIKVTADQTTTLDFTLTALAPNLAKDATIVSSTDYSPDYDAAKANDGNLGTRWNSAGGDTDGAFLELDWTKAVTFNKITVRESIDRVREYAFQTWDNSKSDWVDIYHATVPVTSGDPIFTKVFTQPVTADKVRFLVVKADNLPSVYEFQVSSVPTGTLEGKVTDYATSKGIEGAAVALEGVGTVATTGADGSFSTIVEPDEYAVSASVAGYLPSDSTILTVTADKPTTYSASLAAVGENLAKKATASDSYDNGTNTADLVIDGDLTTSWQTDAADPANTKNQWVALTWPSATTFRMVSLRGFVGVIQKCQLETQDSAGNWTMIPDTLFNAEFTGTEKTFLFAAPITTKAVRFFIQYTNSDTNVPGLSEFEVYNPPIITVTPPPTVVPGDVNGDGKLGITDVVLALRIVAGIVTATPANTAAGDIDKSGAITITDVVKMLRAVAGITPLG